MLCATTLAINGRWPDLKASTSSYWPSLCFWDERIAASILYSRRVPRLRSALHVERSAAPMSIREHRLEAAHGHRLSRCYLSAEIAPDRIRSDFILLMA